MRPSLRALWLLSSILMTAPGALAFSRAASLDGSISRAQTQITTYLAKLADLHCTESVTQEKLTADGHVEVVEKARYDYLIMMSGSGEEFQLNESRIEADSGRTKRPSLPMLITNGVATVLLVFHPYYRDGFTFESGEEETVNGRAAIPIRFTHIPGRRTPAALALRGRQYPLELTGTAWLDEESGDVVKVDAGLVHDMSDVGLRSLHIHVEYKHAKGSKNVSSIMLPALAVVEVTTPRQHWRNTHVFDEYKSFSTDAEQDPNVKVRAANPAPNGAPGTNPDSPTHSSSASPSSPPSPKEKP